MTGVRTSALVRTPTSVSMSFVYLRLFVYSSLVICMSIHTCSFTYMRSAIYSKSDDTIAVYLHFSRFLNISFTFILMIILIGSFVYKYLFY